MQRMIDIIVKELGRGLSTKIVIGDALDTWRVEILVDGDWFTAYTSTQYGCARFVKLYNNA